MSSTFNMQPWPLRFAMPPSLQRFDLFSMFPYDIRHMIWEDAIFIPGIHFLKFAKTADSSAVRAHGSPGANSGGSLATLSPRRADTRDAEDPIYSAALEPVFPIPCADNSYYITMSKTFAQLRDSCSEAKSLVEKVLARPGNLTLDSGQLVLLERSSDVVCIDYPHMSDARYLGKWAEHLDLSQLAKVRRLAIRYHHEWDNDLVCAYCGRVHSYSGKHPYPRHVYEFAALFKNLEVFYFIDYLTVRKSARSPRCPHQRQDPGRCRERFSCGEGGRTYFEVDADSCTTHTRVFETLSWLRNNYIVHCMCKSQGPPRPERVQFKILACEWDSDQKLASVKRPEVQSTPARKKRSRNRTSDLTNSSLGLNTSTAALPLNSTDACALPVVFGDDGKSKFDFTLEIPYSSETHTTGKSHIA
ncbi:hypothetical protein F5Y19DRAFT_212545 [Xylariaceae sp. FL1651]|nr:hypothetical protein F5Y19DRAFT_212545 [Xylariaceae sp. FL1651]